MVSPHPNNDVQIQKITTITLFHAFFKFFKFGRFEVSTLYINRLNSYFSEVKLKNNIYIKTLKRRYAILLY